jgi:hypothetical protein
MPETPRSSFRLRQHTLERIEDIREHYRTMNRYDRTTKTDVIERAIDELHRRFIPPASTTTNPPERNRS